MHSGAVAGGSPHPAPACSAPLSHPTPALPRSYTFFKVDEEEVEEEEEAGAGAPAAISPAAALQPITVAAAAPAQ